MMQCVMAFTRCTRMWLPEMQREDNNETPYVIGLDIGGTNTDVVLLKGKEVLASAKVPSGPTGVNDAIRELVSNAKHDFLEQVQAVFLGTTAFINALLEGRGLDRVAAVRLCGPSSRSLPPFVDFCLKDVVSAGTWLASGGLRFDGSPECHVDETELQRMAAEIALTEAQAVVVSGTFSPSDPSQEEQAARILRDILPSSTRVTISSQFGQLGLLARENAAILNACLVTTARSTAIRTRRALRNAGIPPTARLFFTANDGSVISFAQVAKSPLKCVACGPTNSLRGASFLVGGDNSNSTDADAIDRIVLDVGGTSTDAGCLVKGLHPRDSNAVAYIAGIRCNHRTSDVVSIALGGGSIVKQDASDGGISIGPESVGADITSKALCFGGTVCTATCIAVAMGANVGWSDSSSGAKSSEIRHDFDHPPFAAAAWDVMQKCFYDLVEKTRSDNRPVEVVLVGGGAGLVDSERLSRALGDCCSVILTDHASVANACGSALAQAVGEAEIIADLSPSGKDRETVLREIKAKAKDRAGPGAWIIECEEVPLAYLPGKTTRIFVRAVAPLNLSKAQREDSSFERETEEDLDRSQGLALRRPDPSPVKPSPPHIADDGTWTITEYDAHCLAIGCGILSCGGGGSTFHGLLQLLEALHQDQPIRVVPASKVPSDAVVAPCGFMGAPTVDLETIGGADQLVTVVRQSFEMNSTESVMNPTFIAISEIGGSNGIVPLLVGGLMDLPVVDADLMGRAFPELQMTTPLIYGLPQTPMVVSDSFGRSVSIHGAKIPGDDSPVVPADEAYWAERILRPVCVEFGCSAGLVDPLLSGSELARVGVMGSLSRARRIGDCMLRSNHPAEAIEHMLQQEGGKCIFRGMVSDVQRETTAGFARGTLQIISEDDKGCTMTIQFQNEFLIAHIAAPESDVAVAGCVPDIISLIDVDTARPIATEEVRFGFRVCVVLLPVSRLLRTREALKVVGPRAFGLAATYMSDLYEHEGGV